MMDSGMLKSLLSISLFSGFVSVRLEFFFVMGVKCTNNTKIEYLTKCICNYCRLGFLCG